MRSPTSETHLDTARELMDAFLSATGVVGEGPRRRYLWTDAFAVCTLLALDEAGASPPGEVEASYRELALRLVDRVHRVLGRHRPDDPREGWISGLDEEEGARHPTAGGLRIGKPLPERGPDDPVDRQEEWERDGQYFHYLTRWMHALRRAASETGEPRYLRWAVELAQAAHRGFVHRAADGDLRMHWKMSIDLTRPLVPEMGRHDPLDGYLTFRTLTAPDTPAGIDDGHGLQEATAAMATLAGLDEPSRWVTADPLGLGGLLVDAHRVALLRSRGVAESEELLLGLLAAVDRGLAALRESRHLDRPPATRLPFRELGLSLGIHAVERTAELVDRGALRGAADRVEGALGRLLEGAGMARQIEATWTEPEARALDVWTDHEDINTVMLATSLLPDGYLRL